jgi:hypothetical protein
LKASNSGAQAGQGLWFALVFGKSQAVIAWMLTWSAAAVSPR